MRSLILRTFVLMIAATAAAQQGPPVATGLRAPMEVAFTHAGNLIVSEAGNGPNTGRISLVDRTGGGRRTLVDGLPSGFHPNAQPNVPPAPSGPGGMALSGSTLYLTIGNGDSVVPGPLPGTEVPGNPSSPILSSVLAIRASTSLDVSRGGFTLQPSQHAQLKSGETVTLRNDAGEELSIRVVVDFPDYTAEPRPDFPQNVRLMNTFGVAAVGQTLFVVDASQNRIFRVDANTGEYSTLTTFSRISNPTPVGPPMTDAVPNSVRVRNNELLVTTLSGFPFPAGAAEVRRVDMTTGQNEPLIGGLTSAIDVQPLGNGPMSPMLVLEFSVNQREGQPGRLSVVAPGAEPVTIASGLITPTGIAVDRRSGEIFITHLGPGIVTRVSGASAFATETPNAILPIIGSATGAFGSSFRTVAQLTNYNAFPISGRIVFHQQGRSAQADDPSLAYTLQPFETRSFADLIGAAGASGVGTGEIIPAVGGVPAVVVRIVDTSSGSSRSVQVPIVEEAQRLEAGTRGVLIAPADTSRTRFNVGIRALESGAHLAVRVYDSGGVLVRTRELFYEGGYFVQVPASELTGGPVGSNHSLVFEVLGGSAVIYGATVDNDGEGMTLQVAAPVW